MRDHYISAEGLVAALSWVAVFVLLTSAGVVLTMAPGHHHWAAWMTGIACAMSAVAAVLNIRCMLARLARLIRTVSGFGDDGSDGREGKRLQAVP